MKNLIKLFALAIVILGFSATSFGQLSATATASAAIVSSLNITNKVNMNFGSIAGTDAGTVTLPVTGVRTPSAGLTLPGTTFAPASFEVTGAKGTTYNISIPTAAISTTTNPAGATAMTIDTWVSESCYNKWYGDRCY